MIVSKKKKAEIEKIGNLKELNYPVKILVAWGEAISGNAKIRDFLSQNGYPELGIFVFALNNKDDAREWLMKNGYAHLMAMINGGEGNNNAIKWLKKNGYHILANMALFIDREDSGFEWLIKNDYKVFAFLAQKMRIVKDKINDNNVDPHHISF